MCNPSDFKRFNADRKRLGDLKQPSMFSRYMRAYHMLTPEQRMIIDSGGGAAKQQPGGGVKPEKSLAQQANTLVSGAISIDHLIDEAAADGRYTPEELAEIRRGLRAQRDHSDGLAEATHAYACG